MPIDDAPTTVNSAGFNDRERFLRVMCGQPVDQVPNHELSFWHRPSTGCCNGPGNTYTYEGEIAH